MPASDDRRLLVVYHSKGGSTARLADEVIAGARDDAITGVDVAVASALDAGADDVRAADALILGTPENLGYMSGAMKHFFDSVYYELLEETVGLPYALFVKASTDGTGAIRGIERIVTGLKWRAIQPPLLVVGAIEDQHREAARELGMSVAAALDAGLL